MKGDVLIQRAGVPLSAQVNAVILALRCKAWKFLIRKLQGSLGRRKFSLVQFRHLTKSVCYCEVGLSLFCG